MKRVPILLAVLLTAALCSARDFSVEFIGYRSFPFDYLVDGTAFNGLSGLAYDPAGESFLVISDDRSEHGHARLYNVKAKVGNQVEIVPGKVVFLRDSKNQFFPPNSLDPEGIVALANDNLLISSERSPENGRDPALMEFTVAGEFVRYWPLPEQFQSAGKAGQGIRDNLGFESLTITPDKRFVFTANEQALMQDGGTVTVTEGSKVRIVKYDQSGMVTGQFPYMVSELPNPTGADSLRGHNGLVEMIALDENQLLTLERSWVPRTRKVTVRLYHIDLEGAEAVSSQGAFAGADSVRKTLLLDMDELPWVSDTLPVFLDNLEGMALGADLPGGGQTLLLVSDGNFNKMQHTLFLAFRLKALP